MSSTKQQQQQQHEVSADVLAAALAELSVSALQAERAADRRAPAAAAAAAQTTQGALASLSDAALSRCLWPESAEALERFAAAHPRAPALHALWWAHQTFAAGGPHALWVGAHQRGLFALSGYLVRVHEYCALRTPLAADHAAFLYELCGNSGGDADDAETATADCCEWLSDAGAAAAAAAEQV